MSVHAPLPPSSAARWGAQCPASVTLEREHSGITDAEAESDRMEGDAAHWFIAQDLKGTPAAVGDTAPNRFVITDEIVEATALFLDEIAAHRFDGKLHVEEIVRCSSIHRDNWGTPDLWKFIAEGIGGTIYLWDYKHGHRYVDVFENWQLIDYVACILSGEEFIGMDRRAIKVVSCIIQPRNYHPSGPVRKWETTADKLHTFFTQLETFAEEATGPNPRAMVGPECRDCKGRHACQALHDAADSVADTVGGIVALELPPEALGYELRTLERADDLLTARLTGLRAYAESLIRAGKNVPFYQLTPATGREIWTKTTDEVLQLGDLMGVDLKKPTAAITPAQARKAGLTKEVVAGFAARPPGGVKLTQIDLKEARKVFST